MRTFRCSCGHTVYFENTSCMQCHSLIGYDPLLQSMFTLSRLSETQWVANNQQQYKLCQNYIDYHFCNWLVPSDSNDHYCLACGLNQIIPSLLASEKRVGRPIRKSPNGD